MNTMNRMPDIWGGGQLLAFSGIDGRTDYNNGLCLRTAMQGCIFELKNHPAGSPDARVVYIGPSPDRIELTGDFFRFHAGNRVSSGVIADAANLLLDGDFALESAREYESAQSGTRFVIAGKGFLRKDLLSADLEQLISERAVFLREAPVPPDVSENSRCTALKAWSQLKTQVYAPEGLIHSRWSTPDRWPHRKMWLWDSAFHALGMRHYDPQLAREMVSAMFDLQQPDGLIPHSGNPYGFHPCTQPPVLSLAMRMIDELDPAPEWIAESAPKLERYLEWIMANRDSDGAGLVEWQISAHENCRSGESGMDNSPRFDGAIQLDAPDFNAYLAYECESLAQFLPERRDYWMAHHERICKLMRERLWSEECGMFVDYDVKCNRRTDIMSSAGFLPLYCGAATPEQAARLAAHLTDPETFGTPLRVPSIAKCNTAAYRKDMWRGPVWTNINYLIALGLERYGYHDLARSIVQDTLREQEKWYLNCGSFFEFYDDRKEVEPRALDRKGKMPPGQYQAFHQVFHDYGWSATLYLEMLFHPEWRS
ncbi:MAG: flagellar biosynthesis protein FlgM [Lentisphaeria bacterium]|nr:flagellar biosynthesis protein FlgM [Lentisphaeria bacterium]